MRAAAAVTDIHSGAEWRKTSSEKGKAQTRERQKRIMDFLRANAGVKFFKEEIATKLELPVRTVSVTLHSTFSKGHSNLRYEEVQGMARNWASRKWWYGPAIPEKASDLRKAIVKWMIHHRKKQAIPSVIAAAIEDTPGNVKRELLAMCETADAVKCERCTVHPASVDRFEFRLMGAL